MLTLAFPLTFPRPFFSRVLARVILTEFSVLPLELVPIIVGGSSSGA